MSVIDTASKRLHIAAAATVIVLVMVGWLDLNQHYVRDFGRNRSALAPALSLFLSVARALPILLCRKRPVLGFTAVGAACLATASVTRPYSDGEVWPWAVTSQACILAALALAGAAAGRRTAVVMGSAYLTVTAVLAGIGTPTLVAAVEVVVVLIGLEILRERNAARQALVVQEEISEAERTRRTLLEERARIGRELHDVVAHHMSLIAVQAETAPYRLPGQSPEVEAEFRSISAASREALTDMRKILGLLRADSAAAETAPQPSLGDIASLVHDAQASLVAVGEANGVPPIVGVSAYRIVQESLSNARRHAPGAKVLVRVDRTPSAVRIEVRNDPTGRAPKPEAGGGHGITGMRERVALVGGEFSAGPTREGGFAVTAVLPLERKP